MGGGHGKLTPMERGGGENDNHAEGGGAQKVLR